jgi:histone H3/H4
MGIFLKKNAFRDCINRGGSMLVVKAKIKEYTGEYNVAGDFADALHAKVEVMIKDAIKRAEANGRKTVMAKDL